MMIPDAAASDTSPAAFAALTVTLRERSDRLDALQDELQKKDEEQEVVRQSTLLMQQQLQQLRSIAMQRLGKDPPPSAPPSLEVGVAEDAASEFLPESGSEDSHDAAAASEDPLPPSTFSVLRQPLRVLDEAFLRGQETLERELQQPLRQLDGAIARGGQELAAWGRNGADALKKITKQA